MKNGKSPVKLVRTGSKKIREIYEDRDDRIVGYLIGKFKMAELPQKDKEIISRLLSAHRLLCQGYSPYQIAKMQTAAFPGICEATARNDIRRANKLLGKLDESTEETRWALLWEIGREKFALHNKNKDYKEAALYFKELVKINENYKSAIPEEDEPKKFILEIHTKGGEKQTIDLDNEADIKDIPYETIIEGIESQEYNESELEKLLTPQNARKAN